METKTVKQIVDEYLNRQKNAEIESLLITIGGDRHSFRDVTNFKEIKSGTYEFDYIQRSFEDNSKQRKHVKCSGVLLMVVSHIDEE